MMFSITITPYLRNRYCFKNTRKYLKMEFSTNLYNPFECSNLSYGENKQTKSYLP